MDIKEELEKSLREQSQFVSVTVCLSYNSKSYRYPGRDKCKKQFTSVNLNCH